MPPTADETPLGAVYFEFTAIGHSVKVVARSTLPRGWK
jgi:hypothetical protein